MSATTFILIIVSALLHSIWNVAAKTRSTIYAFSFLTAVVATVYWLPVVICISLYHPEHSPLAWSKLQWTCASISAFIHTVYYLLLLHGYQAAPLSVVYPVARGSGSLLSALFATIVFGEHLTRTALLGIGLIVVGIWFLRPLGRSGSDGTLRGTIWGLLIGLTIALYTLVDASGVKTLELFPFTFDYVTGAIRCLMLLPLMPSWEMPLRRAWNADRNAILAVSILSTLSYVLLLAAVQSAPLSRVAPAREISMLFGTFLGGSVLKEGNIMRRMAAAAMIAAGVVALSHS